MAATAARRLSARTRARPRQRPGRATGPSGIRWDRVARVSLLVVLVLVLLSFVQPARKYLRAWGLARETAGEVRTLRTDNQRLKATAEKLRQPTTVELEARRVGMARPGERVYVIKRLPNGP
jgi:cell division protein FtsB